MPALLLTTVVFAWGFSWYAIALQIGPVPTEVSIAYRFLLAGGLLTAGLMVTGRWRRAPPSVHPWLVLLGLCLFGANFCFIYAATAFVPSGLVSVVFAFSAIFGTVNAWLLLRQRPGLSTLAGSVCGVLGLACLFQDSLFAERAPGWVDGLLLALAGTYVFSLGNFVSIRVRARLDLPNGVARGMLYGAAMTLMLGYLRHGSLPIDVSPTYLGGLVYLAVVASVVAFLAYLELLGRLGPARAAYATVLFPLVALATSTALEGFRWTWFAGIGITLTLLGAALVFGPPIRWPQDQRRQPAAAEADRS